MVCCSVFICCNSWNGAEYSEFSDNFVQLVKSNFISNSTLLNWFGDHSIECSQLSRFGSAPRHVALGPYRDKQFVSYYGNFLGDS